MTQNDLIHMLQQQRDCTTQLLAVLEQESQAVLSGDMAQLQQVGQAKESCCREISQLESHWPPGLRSSEARHWASQQGRDVSQAWDNLVEELRRCRRQNDANGMLIAERQLWVASKLNPSHGQTYGAGGQATDAAASTWAASV